MNKKITFLISSLAGGGAEGVCVNVANGLASRGWEVNLVVLHMNNSVYHEILDEKVNLVVLNVNNARYTLLPLMKYFKSQKLDKIVVFNYELTVMSIIARFLSLKKFKIIARNINTISKNQNIEKAFLKKMVDFFYIKADFIINQSKGMQEDLHTVYPDVKQKTNVIYNPIRGQIEEYSKTIDFETLQKEDYILCIGRLEEQKAFHYAIEAFAGISKSFPDIRLKIVGQGSLESSLKELAKKLDVQDKVDFEGFHKNTIPFYLNAKLVLLTSLYEGFPNVLIESIALGTPVVAFDCQSGPSEIIEDNINGILVNYLDVSDLQYKLSIALKIDWDYRRVHNSSLKFCGCEIIKQWEKFIDEV